MSLFRSMGVASSKQCELSSVINPFEADCWTCPSSVVKYDLRAVRAPRAQARPKAKLADTPPTQAPKTLDSLFDNLSRLENFVKDGDLEVLLAVLPEPSRTSKLNHWSAAAAGASDLRRRRDAETVISDQEDGTTRPPTLKPAAAGPGPSTTNAARRGKPIPQCFASANSCMTQTNECSGHGECVNKYSSGSGNATASAGASCFVCACKATVVERGDGAPTKGRKTVHWGGNMCQKQDISVPFWLIAGFTVTIIGAVSFAIGLLFSVGEEQLPGVIGAGVSRSK